MTAPIQARDYAITTAGGTALVLVANETIRLATKNPHIGRNECIAALGGAVLGTAVKVGANYCFKNKTQFAYSKNPLIEMVRVRQSFVLPIVSAAVASILYAYVKKA